MTISAMEQSWFELQDVRKRWLVQRSESRDGFAGHIDEYFGTGSIAVPVEQRPEAERLGWTDVGLRDHGPYMQDGRTGGGQHHRA